MEWRQVGLNERWWCTQGGREWGWAAENEFWGEGRRGRNQEFCYGILIPGENVKYAVGSMIVDFRGNVRAGIDFRSHHHLVKIPIHGIKWDYLKKWSEPWHATWANTWGSLIHRQGRDRDPGWSPEASKLKSCGEKEVSAKETKNRSERQQREGHRGRIWLCGNSKE